MTAAAPDFASSLAIRGSWRANAPLRQSNWFQVGGPAEWLFKPDDAESLAVLLAQKPADMTLTVLGVGSNLIIRDGGLPGITVRLGRAFNHLAIKPHGDGFLVTAGAAVLGRNVALSAAEPVLNGMGAGGLEFMIGIPGTVGGMVTMNGGAYGREIKDCLLRAELALPNGSLRWFTREELPMRYRYGGLPESAIVTQAEFLAPHGEPALLKQKLDEIASQREATQPIREKTGGSTFKNPDPQLSGGKKAWQLVDEAGCRGLTLGGAQISEKHCNFMINTGNATAKDLEDLGEEVRRRVHETFGIWLEWEIKRIGYN